MKSNDFEKGLYSPSYEHDACGVGMLVNIHGGKSHEIVDSALTVLENMRQRGAEGADGKTGDGAGIRFLTSLFCYRGSLYPKRDIMEQDWFSCPKMNTDNKTFLAS